MNRATGPKTRAGLTTAAQRPRHGTAAESWLVASGRPRVQACALALAGLVQVAFAQPALPELRAEEPRAFGWRLGDIVERRIELRLPAGWRLLPDSLPLARLDGRAVELQQVRREDSADGVVLRLRWQVMRSPAEPQVLEIAPLTLRVQGPTRVEALRVEAWPLMVSPLLPAEAPTRRGLGPWRPDRLPATEQDRLRPWRVGAEAAFSLGALLALAYAHWGAFWRRDRGRPLADAWRVVQRTLAATSNATDHAAAEPPAVALADALRTLHHALNQYAGRVLQPAGIAAFCTDHPTFVPLADALQRLFALSNRVFYEGADAPPGSAAELRTLARRLRDAERDAAARTATVRPDAAAPAAGDK